jgi:hypothetical protein
MNPRWECDKAVADASEDGAQAYIAVEGSGMVEASFQTVARQFYYGASTTVNLGDTLGFPGLIDAYDSTSMVVDAGGTSANTGSSLWAVRWGAKDVQWVYGLNGQLNLSDVSEQRVTDANSNAFTAYVQELLAYPGVQVGSVRSIGRIKKLTADSGKGLTDALISSLLALFPVGMGPDVLYCTRRSLKQLQQSRTATNATGAPAPIPTESFGIPIYPTDALVDTESLSAY